MMGVEMNFHDKERHEERRMRELGMCTYSFTTDKRRDGLIAAAPDRVGKLPREEEFR